MRAGRHNQSSHAAYAGFTLVEILVALSIMVLLSTLLYTSLSSYARRQQYSSDVVSLTRSLMEQRTKSLAALNDSVYGAAVEANSLVLFSGSTYVPGAVSNIIVPLSYARASTSLSNYQNYVVFNKITGTASATGTIWIVSDVLLSTTTLSIYGSGLIE